MTIGQRETIIYRGKVVRMNRSNERFLPPHGIGYGLGDDLGIVLNRTVKSPSKFRTAQWTVIGIVVAEDADRVVIERDNGRRLRIPVSDIIERTAPR